MRVRQTETKRERQREQIEHRERQRQRDREEREIERREDNSALEAAYLFTTYVAAYKHASDVVMIQTDS